MTDYSGFIFEDPYLAPRPTEAAVVRTRTSPNVLRTALDFAMLPLGSLTDTQPVELHSVVLDGDVLRSFFEDYYNRIHFIPLFIDFGAVAARTQRDVVIWNAYLDSVDLSGISIENGDDITVEGPTLPATMGALQYLTYAVIALQEGALTINAIVTFDFDGVETIAISVTGIRAKVAPVIPNWGSKYKLSYEFRTETIVSRAGKEQRRALRATTRKKLEFKGNPLNGDLRSFEATMSSWQNNPVIFPEYPRKTKLALEMEAGSAQATLEEIPDWVVDGALLVLHLGDTYDTRVVASVDDVLNVVTFTGSSFDVWPAGSFIHPGLTGRFATTIRNSLKTNTVGAVTVTYDVTPASESVLPVPTAISLFNGRELYMVKPNWLSSPSIDFTAVRDVVDFGRGRNGVFSPVPFQTRVETFTYLGKNYDVMYAALSFFRRCKGQRGEFYMPTWEQDVILSGLAPAGTTSLRVKGTDFNTAYGSSTVHKALSVFMDDGTVYNLVIESIEVVDDLLGRDSKINLPAVLVADIDATKVRMCSWLLVWRFASDSFTVQWRTSEVAEYTFALRSLEDLT